MLGLMHWWYTAERGLWLGMSLLLACTSVGDTGDSSALAASDGATSDVLADPVDRAMFESEEQYQASCRCQSYGFPEGVDPRAPDSVWRRIELLSLDCECSSFGCDREEDQLATIGPALCARYGQPMVIRKQGCGQLAFDFENGYIYGGAVFDATSGALIGRSAGSDVPQQLCSTTERRAGQSFRCDTAESCLLCGNPTGRSAPPPCD